MGEQHWSEGLSLRGLPVEGGEITLPVHEGDPGSVLVVLSRIGPILDAMRTPYAEDGTDTLRDADKDDLYHLVDHVHRVRMVLEGFEERALIAGNDAGLSLRTLTSALELNSPETVRYRLDKIRRAHAQGLLAAAYDDDPTAGDPI